MSKKEIVKKEAAQEIVAYTKTKSMGVTEDVTGSDVQMPSVMLMQANSTLAKDRGNEIKSGDFVNSITKEVVGSFENPLQVCVVDMFKTLVTSEIKGNNWLSTKMWEPTFESVPYTEELDGTEVKNQKCYNYVCFRPLDIREIEMPTGEKKYVASPFVIRFKGASGKNAKKFNQLCQDYALFGQQSWCVNFDLTATEETKDSDSYWVYDFTKAGQALEETQKAAAAMCEMSQAARKAGTLNVVDLEDVDVEKTVKNIPNHAPKAGPVPVERF